MFNKLAVGQKAGENTGSLPIVQVTFVDDAVFMLSSLTPHILHSSIDAICEAIFMPLVNFGFQINFAAGKTEAFLRFSGKLATKYAKIRGLGDSLPHVQMSDSLHSRVGGDGKLRIVQSYVHLGTTLADRYDCDADVHRRASSAMTSYVAIAGTVFSSKRLNTKLN